MRRMKIYYFSTTGNSLTTARRIAEGLGGCELVPVMSARQCTKLAEEDAEVGFVFPVYFSDMPYPVRDLISKMVFRENSYIFAVTTARGHSGAVNQRTDQLLRTRGQKLSLSVGINMPGNSYINEPGVDEMHLAGQDRAVSEALKRIAARETCDYSTGELLPLRQTAWPNNFRGIEADETCTGCGLCARLCPMDNIRIEKGRAVMGDDCATCLACFHWCPAEAVWMSRQENIARRSKYHHPEIGVEDILAQKGD